VVQPSYCFRWACASLAATAAACIRSALRCEDRPEGQLRLELVADSFIGLADTAAELLQFAAHQVAAGRAGGATLALAAAAQRAALECGEFGFHLRPSLVHHIRKACKDEPSNLPDSTGAPDQGTTGGLKHTTHCMVPLYVCLVARRLYQVRQGLWDLQAAMHNMQAASNSPTAAAPTGPQPSAAGSVQSVLCTREEQMQLLLQQQQPVDAAAAISALQGLLDDIAISERPRLQLVGCSWLGCKRSSASPSLGSTVATYTAESTVAGRKGVRCGGCGLVRYCCPEHQKEDWPRHRHVCRRLAQARVKAPV
jgi:hypothetical protein